MKVPPELDKITDAVLAYKPKPKTKAAKRRARRNKRKDSKQLGKAQVSAIKSEGVKSIIPIRFTRRLLLRITEQKL